ncbi:MAG: tryptophan-rich sensory protein [Candidatus Cloacimonetes bacterium]|nr:tryptophan-rich sensory protein [Candidatus Cloacimonadota bacterium]MBS3766884.1 tryptophan-rich sensory protein [Candidatus Cloacimonadota bacterium]
MRKLGKFILSILLPLAIGFFASFFTQQSVETWYKLIDKPVFNPPDWIFAPVWTILYIIIGIAFYLVWQKNFGSDKKRVLTIYFVQLFLNFLWSFLFFGMQSPIAGLVEIILLWIVIFMNIKVFYRVTKTAGYLLIPYLAWVSFALILNFSIVIIN